MPTFDANGPQLAALVGNAFTLVNSASGASAGAAITTTLPADTGGKTTYLTGFQVTADHATATVESLLTISGLVQRGGTPGTLLYRFVQSSTLGGILVVQFTTPIPANGPNAAITLSLASVAGGGNVTISVQGFWQA